MKKKISFFIILLAGSLLGQAQDPTAARAELKRQKGALRSTILSLPTGPQLIDALKAIRVQFTQAAADSGLTDLIHKISDVLQQECRFVATNPEIKQYVQRSVDLTQEIQAYQQSPNYKQIQRLRQQEVQLRSSAVLEHDQGEQLQALQEKIDQLLAPLNALKRENSQITQAITARLAPYRDQVADLRNQAIQIAQTDRALQNVRQQILSFKTTPEFNQVMANNADPVIQNLNAIQDLYQTYIGAGNPCVEQEPGKFFTAAQILRQTYQDIINTLIA